MTNKDAFLQEEVDRLQADNDRLREGKWPHTIDAQVWAEKWLETLAEHPDIATDEGAMTGWFANAIMAGYDQARKE